jgi:uncharacterized protein (DUF433 family)
MDGEISTALNQTAYRHIVLDDNGFPVIEESNTKVIELVAGVQAHGLSPEELCYQLPHLSLGQIHSALAYYWDHKEEIDRDLERRAQRAEELQRELGQPPLVARLKQRASSEERLESYPLMTERAVRPRQTTAGSSPARTWRPLRVCRRSSPQRSRRC